MSSGSKSNPDIAAYNFNAVPRHIPTLLEALDPKPKAVPLQALIPIPRSSVADTILSYVKEKLPTHTLHHSLRVYQYGTSIAETFFPEHNLNRETFFLTSLLHDIGTTPENLHSALISFEFQGGLIAHSLIREHNNAQAEAVAEAIIRHQDVDDIGNGEITFLGALIQLATLYDNAGANDELVADETRELVVHEIPRLKWSGCFESVIREECETKPWAHTTKMGKEKFIGLIRGNSKGNAME